MSAPPGPSAETSGPQRRVQYRAPLGGVDEFSAPHGLDARARPAGVGQAREQVQAVVIDALAREIQIDPAASCAKRLPRAGLASRSVRRLTVRV